MYIHTQSLNVYNIIHNIHPICPRQSHESSRRRALRAKNFSLHKRSKSDSLSFGENSNVDEHLLKRRNADAVAPLL